jgi:NAD(P)-dependent dehydrogenase (short-subunit alcohol dehydrogenase family)
LFFKKKPYDKVQAYANSKLANVLFTRRLAHLLNGNSFALLAS